MQCPWDKCRQLPRNSQSHSSSVSISLTGCLDVFAWLSDWLLVCPAARLAYCPCGLCFIQRWWCRFAVQSHKLPLGCPLVPICRYVGCCCCCCCCSPHCCSCSCCSCCLNKSKEIAFNVHLQQIKIKSIAWRRLTLVNSPGTVIGIGSATEWSGLLVAL